MTKHENAVKSIAENIMRYEDTKFELHRQFYSDIRFSYLEIMKFIGVSKLKLMLIKYIYSNQRCLNFLYPMIKNHPGHNIAMAYQFKQYANDGKFVYYSVSNYGDASIAIKVKLESKPNVGSASPAK